MADELALLHQHQLEAAMAPSTPKRKRAGKTTTVGAEAAAVPKFSFRSTPDDAMDAAAAAEEVVPEGCQTPRSSMAMRFRGLALEGGGGGDNNNDVAHARRGVGSRATLGNAADDDTNASVTTTTTTIASRPDNDDEMADASHNTRTMRKRQRVPRAPSAEPAKQQPSPSPEDAPALSSSPVPVPIVPFAAGRRPSLQRSLPSINRFPQPKVRPGQAPSPPAETTSSPDGTMDEMTTAKTLVKRGQRQPKKPVASKTHTTKVGGISPPTSPDESCDDADDDDELAAHIVDPLRASLTWHEDEITVYDPDDSDDDGLGFDGVGFKPSPLVAEARAAKRRQQLLEYRRREESEARDRRSQRRRAAAAAAAEAEAAARAMGAPSEGEEARRVRFMDVESCAC
jgi:hypothetical protein